jgi:hypothetical protein
VTITGVGLTTLPDDGATLVTLMPTAVATAVGVTVAVGVGVGIGVCARAGAMGIVRDASNAMIAPERAILDMRWDLLDVRWPGDGSLGLSPFNGPWKPGVTVTSTIPVARRLHQPTPSLSSIGPASPAPTSRAWRGHRTLAATRQRHPATWYTEQSHGRRTQFMRRRLAIPIFRILAVIALLAISVQHVYADPRDFTLINGTSTVITHVYVGPSDSEDWGDDILGQDVLAPGESVFIYFTRFDGSSCLYDIMVMTREGGEGYLYKIDLCSTTTVTFS